MDNREHILSDLGDGYYIGAASPYDKAAYIQLLNDRAIYENTQGIPFPYTEADAKWWIEHRIINSTAAPTLFAIRKADGAMIGTVDAGSKIVPGRDHISEIGYWLASPYWGRGLMTKAVAWLCDYTFGTLELTRLTAHVFSFNRRSARVLEKNAFQLEGVLRKHHLKDSRFIDALLYARVR